MQIEPWLIDRLQFYENNPHINDGAVVAVSPISGLLGGPNSELLPIVEMVDDSPDRRPRLAGSQTLGRNVVYSGFLDVTIRSIGEASYKLKSITALVVLAFLGSPPLALCRLLLGSRIVFRTIFFVPRQRLAFSVLRPSILLRHRVHDGLEFLKCSDQLVAVAA